MKRMFTMLLLALAATAVQANNVQISNVTTSVTGGTTVLNFSIQWDNSWRGGPGNNYDAVWVFIKYKDDRGFYSHLDMTGSNITAPSNLTVDVPADHKGCFVYRSADGQGSVASSQVSVGIVQKPGSYNVKVFGIEMVYIPAGSFYLGHSGGNTNNFGVGGSAGTVPFQITDQYPPSIGSNSYNLYDGRVVGSASINSAFPTGFNAFYMMKYELSQAGYRDFLNAAPGYASDVLSERTDLTSSNYYTKGTKAFPGSYRNNLYVTGTSSTGYIGADANNNGVGNESNDGEWTAANFLYWSDAAAFLDWAALRPMTEFEYEKAVNGPDAVNYPQFATGTYIQVPDISGTGILNANTAAETVTTDDNSGNNYINTNEFWGSNTSGGNIGQPLRSGFAAKATSNRRSSGGSYYGVMDLSGNLWEPVVTVANAAGRSFTGQLGDGSISALKGRANTPGWPGVQNNLTLANGAGEILKDYTAGISKRGGSFNDNLYFAVTDQNYDPAIPDESYPTTRDATKSYGCRGVRQQ